MNPFRHSISLLYYNIQYLHTNICLSQMHEIFILGSSQLPKMTWRFPKTSEDVPKIFYVQIGRKTISSPGLFPSKSGIFATSEPRFTWSHVWEIDLNAWDRCFSPASVRVGRHKNYILAARSCYIYAEHKVYILHGQVESLRITGCGQAVIFFFRTLKLNHLDAFHL